MALNRCAYVILGILRQHNATDEIHGLTILEIALLEKVSKPNTIHKRIKELETDGYIQEGIKSAKAKTYFIQKKGLELLPVKKEDK